MTNGSAVRTLLLVIGVLVIVIGGGLALSGFNQMEAVLG